MKIFFFAGLFLAITPYPIAAQSYVPEKKNKMLVANTVPVKVFPVPAKHVKFLAGPFKAAMEAGWVLFQMNTVCEQDYRMAISATGVRFKKGLVAMVHGT